MFAIQQAQRDHSNAPMSDSTASSSYPAQSAIVAAHAYNINPLIYNLKDPSEIERLLTSTNPPPDPNNISLPTWEQTKCSVRENGHIIAYAANTNQGIIRDYNED